MSNNIVVIYTFSLNQGVNTQQLLDASEKLDALLLKMPGFLYRSLTKLEDGKWQDIVYWDNAAALKKADSMNDNPDFTAMMNLLDVSSVVRTQASVHSSVYPEMATA